MKNVHELLAKLAWDFSPQQLDHLFECFQVWLIGSTCSCTLTEPLLYVLKSVPAVFHSASSVWDYVVYIFQCAVYRLHAFANLPESVQGKCSFFLEFLSPKLYDITAQHTTVTISITKADGSDTFSLTLKIMWLLKQ